MPEEIDFKKKGHCVLTETERLPTISETISSLPRTCIQRPHSSDLKPSHDIGGCAVRGYGYKTGTGWPTFYSPAFAFNKARKHDAYGRCTRTL